MNWELLIRMAGLGLLLIALANFIVPSMLNYRANLAKVDREFAQIFTVHAVYIVVTVLGMGALCLRAPHFSWRKDRGGRGLSSWACSERAALWCSFVTTIALCARVI